MSETITLEEITTGKERDTIVSHCIFHCVAELMKSEEFMTRIKEEKKIEVCLTINGTEVSLRSFLEEFQRQHDWMLSKVAERALSERMSKFFDFASGLDRMMRDKFREAFGVEIDDR